MRETKKVRKEIRGRLSKGRERGGEEESERPKGRWRLKKGRGRKNGEGGRENERK